MATELLKSEASQMLMMRKEQAPPWEGLKHVEALSIDLSLTPRHHQYSVFAGYNDRFGSSLWVCWFTWQTGSLCLSALGEDESKNDPIVPSQNAPSIITQWGSTSMGFLVPGFADWDAFAQSAAGLEEPGCWLKRSCGRFWKMSQGRRLTTLIINGTPCLCFSQIPPLEGWGGCC